MRSIVPIALSIAVVLIGCAALVNHLAAPTTELGYASRVARSVDEAVDSAILGQTKESAELSRKEPHIETALDVVSKPNYARDVSRWAAERQLAEAQKMAPQPAKSISALEREQRELRAQLHSMMRHRVRNTADKVDSVLATQAKIAAENKADIHRDLTTNRFNPNAAPVFHSAVLDKPVHVVNAQEEVRSLESELARKIAAGDQLEKNDHARNVRREKALIAVKKQHAAAAQKPHFARNPSLAEAAPAAAPAAAAPVAAPAPAAASSSGSDDDKVYAWDSPHYKHAVPYTAVEDDGLPAAQDALRTARARVNARLSAQLQNAKERLERFRSHWSVHMPDELRRATNEGWSSQYSKDYMNEGKTRADLSTENQLIDSLQRDMDKKYEAERDAAVELRDVQEKARRVEANVADLDREIGQDQRDLSVAQGNAAALRKHLPEYYDDLSDSDYESYKPDPDLSK